MIIQLGECAVTISVSDGGGGGGGATGVDPVLY